MAAVERNTGRTPELNQNEIRAGSREGVVRYVLAIGLGLAAVAMVVVYAVV